MARSSLKAIFLLILGQVLFSAGCSQVIGTQYQKGKFVKEVEKPGISETGRHTVLDLTSPTSVRVYDEVEHGYASERYFEKIRSQTRAGRDVGEAIFFELTLRPIFWYS